MQKPKKPSLNKKYKQIPVPSNLTLEELFKRIKEQVAEAFKDQNPLSIKTNGMHYYNFSAVEDVETYQLKLKTYKEDLKKYNAWIKEQEELKELKEIEALEKKLEALKKKQKKEIDKAEQQAKKTQLDVLDEILE